MLARFTLLGAMVLLTACATAQSDRSVAGESAKCGHVANDGSQLARDLDGLKKKPVCKVLYDKKGNPVDVLQAAGKLNPISADINLATVKGLDVGYAPRLFVLIGRFRDNVSVQDLDLDYEKAFQREMKIVVRDETAMANFSTGAKKGVIFTFVEPGAEIVYACLQADTIGSRNAPTRVFICRSVAKANPDKSLMDEAILAVAQKIGREDYAALNP